jgi:hypothetical protein
MLLAFSSGGWVCPRDYLLNSLASAGYADWNRSYDGGLLAGCHAKE